MACQQCGMVAPAHAEGCVFTALGAVRAAMYAVEAWDGNPDTHDADRRRAQLATYNAIADFGAEIEAALVDAAKKEANMRALEDATFWLVWNLERDSPRCQHDTLGSAVTEAERLARGNPGQRFVVVESIWCAQR